LLLFSRLGCKRPIPTACAIRIIHVRSHDGGTVRIRNSMSRMFRKLRLLKRRFARIRRRCVNYLVTHIIQWRLRLPRFGRRLRTWLGASVVSLVSFAISAAIVIAPQFRAKVDNFQPLESVLSQLGATYGAILALVLTLSIIPIQRAAQAWSSSIIRLYRRDRATHITFVRTSTSLHRSRRSSELWAGPARSGCTWPARVILQQAPFS
jgi:hypothetical protein